MPKLSSKLRQEIVDHLVGNCECQTEPMFSEHDSETLSKLDTEQLKDIASGDANAEDVLNELEEENFYFVEEEDLEEATFNEEDLPEEIQEELLFARTVKAEQKEALVESITSNSSSEAYTEEELLEKPLEDLVKLEQLVSNSTNKVNRVATPKLGGNNSHVSNSSSFDDKDILEIPAIEFNR